MLNFVVKFAQLNCGFSYLIWQCCTLSYRNKYSKNSQLNLKRNYKCWKLQICYSKLLFLKQIFTEWVCITEKRIFLYMYIDTYVNLSCSHIIYPYCSPQNICFPSALCCWTKATDLLAPLLVLLSLVTVAMRFGVLSKAVVRQWTFVVLTIWKMIQVLMQGQANSRRVHWRRQRESKA